MVPVDTSVFVDPSTYAPPHLVALIILTDHMNESFPDTMFFDSLLQSESVLSHVLPRNLFAKIVFEDKEVFG